MGYHHSKPIDCPTIFECHGKMKRAEVVKNALYNAYEHNPVAVGCLMCVLFLLVGLGINVAFWRLLSNHKARELKLKLVRASHAEAEKGIAGGYSDDN